MYYIGALLAAAAAAMSGVGAAAGSLLLLPSRLPLAAQWRLVAASCCQCCSWRKADRFRQTSTAGNTVVAAAAAGAPGMLLLGVTLRAAALPLAVTGDAAACAAMLLNAACLTKIRQESTLCTQTHARAAHLGPQQLGSSVQLQACNCLCPGQACSQSM